MGGHPCSVLHCVICAEPVDLTVDLSADENGKAVHEAGTLKRGCGNHADPLPELPRAGNRFCSVGN